MSELMEKFEAVCATNGDDTAFYTCQINEENAIQSVGFSELNSNINLIASELHNRHSLRPAFTALNRHRFASSHVPSEDFMKVAGSKCVLIVSDQPSPGEAAAVMACARLHITFVPIALSGLHRTNDSRVKIILEEIQPVAAVLVLSLAQNVSESHEDDCETKPAFSSNEYDIDSHPLVIKLNHLGVNRIISVRCQDGSVIGSMAGIADEYSCLKSLERMDEDGRDPMYILYTSGSTSSKPKSVLQTYSGLWNRICWQWRTFPFVQQMRRTIGLKDTINLLREDGLLMSDVKNMTNINDIVLRRTALSFVDSMAEIFATLLGGASLFCPLYLEGAQESQRESMGLLDILDIASRNGILVSRMTCLPSQLSQAFRHHTGTNHNYSDWTESLDLVVVSGEPCPRSLPPLFDKKMKIRKATLVNLYGQTESSGDVSCLVASSGVDGEPLQRFPEANKYIWKSSNIESKQTEGFIQKCSISLIPCGLPIDNHNFSIQPATAENSRKEKYGCLFVSGPGIGLGYHNNRPEMQKNFITCGELHENDHVGDNEDTVVFNTMDIAFEDNSGFIFVIGRAAKDSDDVGGGTGCSLTMGKLNGVLVHAAEIEDIFCASLKTILLQHRLFHEDFHPEVIAVLHRDCVSGENKSAVFVDMSSFPNESISFQNNINNGIIEASNIVFAGSDKNFHDLVIDVRSILRRKCHPTMIPHFVHAITHVPTNGAAGKIDRLHLTHMLANKLEKKRLNIRKKGECDLYETCVPHVCFLWGSK